MHSRPHDAPRAAKCEELYVRTVYRIQHLWVNKDDVSTARFDSCDVNTDRKTIKIEPGYNVMKGTEYFVSL
jgi:hypothetical protein